MHGPAHCHWTKCRCDPGYCTSDGQYCSRSPTKSPISTTHPLEQLDVCGVMEYMRKSSFVKAVGICTIMQCGHHIGGSRGIHSERNAPCCTLQCTADTVANGLPDCWQRIAPMFKTRSEALKCHRRFHLPGERESPEEPSIDVITDKNEDPAFVAIVDQTLRQAELAVHTSTYQFSNFKMVIGLTASFLAASLVMGVKLYSEYACNSKTLRFAAKQPLLA